MTDEERLREAASHGETEGEYCAAKHSKDCECGENYALLARFALAVLDLPYVSHGGTNTYIIGRNDGVSETKKAGLAAAFREGSE